MNNDEKIALLPVDIDYSNFIYFLAAMIVLSPAYIVYKLMQRNNTYHRWPDGSIRNREPKEKDYIEWEKTRFKPVEEWYRP